jgi:hypothetical protein
MCCTYPTPAIMGVTLVAALLVPPSVASAGRIVPGPLLSQVEEGYGIAAARVVDAKRATPPDKYPTLYDVVFQIHEIAAQPLKGEAFAFNPGDSITIRLSAGYACQIESDVGLALIKGHCYYLIIRQKKDGTFEHADGASALRGASGFEPSETQYYARLRALAGEPKDRRLMKWIDIVAKPAESERVRSDVLAGVFKKLWPDAKTADGDGAARTRLRQLWNDPQANLSLALLQQLDHVLRATDREFENSSDRREVWRRKTGQEPK